MSEEKMLEECRAVWEATKPDAVFSDFWLGWKASRESLVIELPSMTNNGFDGFYPANAVKKAIEAAGLKVAP